MPISGCPISDARSVEFPADLPQAQSNGTDTTYPNPDPNAASETATSNWAVEAAMDVEWTHAIAPMANIVLIESQFRFVRRREDRHRHGTKVVGRVGRVDEFRLERRRRHKSNQPCRRAVDGRGFHHAGRTSRGNVRRLQRR